MQSSKFTEIDISDLLPGQTKAAVHDSLSLLVCNVGGEIHVVENVCSHAATPLTEGTLDGCELECEFHGAVFDVRDGRALALPATEPLRVFRVERGDGKIRVYL